MNPTAKINNQFDLFLNKLDDYLQKDGWYVNGDNIRRVCTSYEDVITYLSEHCYSATESRRIVSNIKKEIT